MPPPTPVVKKIITPGSKDWAIPPDLAAIGCVKPSNEFTYRLVVSNSAHEKSGKSHLSFTAPDPIGYINTDVGDEGVVEKFMKQGKKIVVSNHKPPGELIRIYKSEKIDTKDVETLKKKYDLEWRKIALAYGKMLESSWVRSIVIDTATEVYEMLKLARFGKLTQVMPYHYGPVNDEYRSFIRQIFNTDKNLILNHKVKKQYQSTGKKNSKGEDESAWNGEYEMAGYADTKYIAQINVQSYRMDDEETGKEAAGEFALRVIDCRQNKDVAGLELIGGECNFPMLASQVFENDEKDWK